MLHSILFVDIGSSKFDFCFLDDLADISIERFTTYLIAQGRMFGKEDVKNFVCD